MNASGQYQESTRGVSLSLATHGDDNERSMIADDLSIDETLNQNMNLSSE
jgi:hypothetical protein